MQIYDNRDNRNKHLVKIVSIASIVIAFLKKPTYIYFLLVVFLLVPFFLFFEDEPLAFDFDAEEVVVIMGL